MVISGLQLFGAFVVASAASVVFMAMVTGGKTEDLYAEIDALQMEVRNNKTLASFELSKRERKNSTGPCDCKYKRHCHLPRQWTYKKGIDVGAAGKCQFIDLIEKEY